ncbi:hypothetical protein GC096_08230 [Paenibacillus sp. LMG 31461]|uniref:Gfo/Idh/MocA-like oxidoreductase N-terminal domain-containing protein n=1 Tax=Paenibacillus plantarum TaxID=2654975 RepID=A0ABX1X7N9_9BACL|nr:Gfo/Idh/MocA family oxidoreductase [Paenibacillus plantarum]NOU64010.1 hypothetical protein [Paenibacillus plantarum]
MEYQLISRWVVEEMLSAAAFDMVSVVVPSYLHKESVLQAARAGKHVICEKQVAHQLEDAQERIACCEEYGVRLFVGHVVRFFPEYAQMKQQIDTGQIGRIGVANARRVGGYPGSFRYAVEFCRLRRSCSHRQHGSEVFDESAKLG